MKISKDKKYSDEYIKKRNEWYNLCWQEIRNANYKLATENAAQGLKLFPKDLFVEFNYYSILAFKMSCFQEGVLERLKKPFVLICYLLK